MQLYTYTRQNEHYPNPNAKPNPNPNTQRHHSQTFSLILTIPKASVRGNARLFKFL